MAAQLPPGIDLSKNRPVGWDQTTPNAKMNVQIKDRGKSARLEIEIMVGSVTRCGNAPDGTPLYIVNCQQTIKLKDCDEQLYERPDPPASKPGSMFR